jgi:hypothetical protein
MNKLKNNLNKKGNLDTFTLITGLFVIGTIIVVLLYAYSQVGDSFSSSPEATNIITGGTSFLQNLGNEGFAFITIGLILFNIIASYLLVTHPIFAIFDFILFPITWWFAAIMSNAWESTMYTFSSASSVPVMNYIMLNLLTIIVVTDIITSIVTYAIQKE